LTAGKVYLNCQKCVLLETEKKFDIKPILMGDFIALGHEDEAIHTHLGKSTQM